MKTDSGKSHRHPGTVYGIARGTTVFELVRHARQRLFYNELFSQGANALCAALAALIVLLLIGADIVDWRWAALIPVTAAAAGLYFARRRTPPPYVAAQIVDRRMALADSLSTALFFHENHRPHVSDGVRQCQLEQAEQASRAVDVRRAVPYSLPRSAYALAALALVASSLFALRYGLTRRLDLKPSLARMVQDALLPPGKKEVAQNARRKPQAPDPTDDSGANAADQDQKGAGQQDAQSPDPSEQGSDTNADKSGASKKESAKQNGNEQNKDSQGQGDQQQADNQDQQDSGQNGSGAPGENKDGKQKESDGKQNANNSSESGSLMSKVKDTLQNLLSHMKPQQQNNASPPQQGANQNSKQGAGQQNGKPQSKDGQQNGSQQADAQQGQSGERQKDAQNSEGKGAGKSDSQQASKQPGSGVGSEDGSKEIRQAEQLAAMGKISEIIGKRSASITGESSVEVQSTSQQLHTAYVQRDDRHTQGGAEINRDEIPVALQPYVQQYFDQLRKVAPAAPATVKK